MPQTSTFSPSGASAPHPRGPAPRSFDGVPLRHLLDRRGRSRSRRGPRLDPGHLSPCHDLRRKRNRGDEGLADGVHHPRLVAHPGAARAGSGNQRPAQTAATAPFCRVGYRLDGNFARVGRLRLRANSGSPHPRGRELPLAPIRLSVDQPGLGARSARRNHAGDDRLRRVADFHLQPRLHGARRELHSILWLLIAFCRGDVRRGHRQ